MELSNQPRKGEIYYGVRIYNNDKYIGSHNGIRLTKKIQWFDKVFFDMFIDELKENIAKNPSLKMNIETKQF